MRLLVDVSVRTGHIAVMQQEENSLKELEALQNFLPFTPSETSYRMGWKGMQAVRYRRIPDSEKRTSHAEINNDLLRTNSISDRGCSA
jgi:hypothetical protein